MVELSFPSTPFTEEQDLRAIARVSMTKLEISGDIGHPCLVPLFRVNFLEPDLLYITLALGEEYNDIIDY